MIRVDLEDIDLLMKLKQKINTPELDEIEFYENGVKLEIDPKVVSDFMFTGLNNVDFIISNYYLRKP